MKHLGAFQYLVMGVCTIGLAVLAADRLADADPFLISQLTQQKEGFKVSFTAQRLKDTACAFECWEKIQTLNTVQLGCLNEQITEVRSMLDTTKNAAYLKKNGIQEIRVRLVDNTNGKIPGEKKYEETKGFLLKWIMEVKTVITSKEECHTASAKILSDLIEHNVTDEAKLEETLQSTQDILQTLIKAPKRVLPAPAPITAEYESPEYQTPFRPELNRMPASEPMVDPLGSNVPAPLEMSHNSAPAPVARALDPIGPPEPQGDEGHAPGGASAAH